VGAYIGIVNRLASAPGRPRWLWWPCLRWARAAATVGPAPAGRRIRYRHGDHPRRI